MVSIMLSENFHRAFSTDDVNQSPDGIIKNVVSVTDRRQTGDDSPRSCIQNDQPGGEWQRDKFLTITAAMGRLTPNRFWTILRRCLIMRSRPGLVRFGFPLSG